MTRRFALLLCLLPIFSTAAQTKTWTGAVNNLFSVGGNWQEGTPPVDGENIHLFSSVANTINNDIDDLVVQNIWLNLGPAIVLEGNGITILGGMTIDRQSECNIPITLGASQTFSSGSEFLFSNTIDLNGQDLTLISRDTGEIGGSIIGTGDLTLWNYGFLNVTGTIELDGVITGYDAQVLQVSGTITESAEIQGSLAVTGTGSVGPVTLDNGAIQPGEEVNWNPADAESSGILTTGSLSMDHGHITIDIAGTVAGTEYDQVEVLGTVTLNSPLLNLNVIGPPAPGATFTILSNDGTDAVSGEFAGAPEGGVISTTAGDFQITYAGGDGNDIELTALSSGPKTWTGAVSGLWSAGGNWSDGIPPVDGDSLIFPNVPGNRTMTNDIADLDLGSVSFTGTAAFPYSVSGNAIFLSGGIDVATSTITWGLPTTFTASQTIDSNDGGTFTATQMLDVEDHQLTILTSPGTKMTLSGPLFGSGEIVLQAGTYQIDNYVTLTANSTFSGTIQTDDAVHLRLQGASLPNATVAGTFYLQGNGVVGMTSVTAGWVEPGTLGTGPLHLQSGVFRVVLTTAPAGAGRLVVNGTVELDALEISLYRPLPAPPAGTVYTIIENDGTDAVVGALRDYAEGDLVPDYSGNAYRLSYRGGDGNDVTLTMMPPATIKISRPEYHFPVPGELFDLIVKVGTATGSVRMYEGPTLLDTQTLVGGTATFRIAFATAGDHNLYFTYDGDSNNGPQTGTWVQTIYVGATQLTLAHNAVVPAGQPINVVAEATPSAPATGTPTGTVSVTIGQQTRSGALSNRLYAANFNGLAPGIYPITATYSGDSNFNNTIAASQIEVVGSATVSDVEVESTTTNTTVDVVVTLSAPSTQTVRIDYATEDITAFDSLDYVGASGTLVFAPGEMSKTITLTIIGDTTRESTETFRVKFSNPQHVALAQTQSNVTIYENVPPLRRRAVRK